MQDEESLVLRAQKRDPEAFTQLYNSHFDKVYRYVVLRIGNKTDAEDITQQVFVNALQSISSYKWRGTPFAAWLFRIARNQVIDSLRKSAREARSPLTELPSSAQTNPEHIAEQRFNIEQLMAATTHLTKAQREVIALRFAGGLSTIEVAKAMGKSQGAVKALQHSALVALRKSIPEER